MTAEAGAAMAISERLSQLAEEAEGDAVSLQWILGQLHERAFGLFLLVLALPCCIPFLYGVPQIVALPLMFVSAQVLLGRDTPWLPGRLAARQVSKAGLEKPRPPRRPLAAPDRGCQPSPACDPDPGACRQDRRARPGAFQRVDPGAAAGHEHGSGLCGGRRLHGSLAARWHSCGARHDPGHGLDCVAGLCGGFLGEPDEGVDRNMTRKILIALAALGSLVVLGSAFGFQHIGGYLPCQMCLWQRYPHGVAMALGMVGVFLPMAWVAGCLARWRCWSMPGFRSSIRGWSGAGGRARPVAPRPQRRTWAP